MTWRDQSTAGGPAPSQDADGDDGSRFRIHRRTLLGAVGAGSTVALAGCLCDSERGTIDLAVDVADIRRRGDGWRTTADVSVAFSGEDKGEVPVRELAVGAFGPDPTTPVAEETVGTIEWEDVP
mgnify:CR=1 FL=1